MNIKISPRAFAILAVLVTGFGLHSGTTEAGIFDHLNIFKKKKPTGRAIVRPIRHPTFGYHATRWRTFPGNQPANAAMNGQGHLWSGDSSGFGGSPLAGSASEYIQQIPGQYQPTTAPSMVAPATPFPAPAPTMTIPPVATPPALMPPTPVAPVPPVPPVAVPQAGLPANLSPPAGISTLPLPVMQPPPARPDLQSQSPFPTTQRMSYSAQVVPKQSRGDFGLPTVRPARKTPRN